MFLSIEIEIHIKYNFTQWYKTTEIAATAIIIVIISKNI